MARTLSMKDAAERLERLPAILTHEGEDPVVAVVRRGHPVLAVLPWDLYVGLLQTLAALPEDVASAQRVGIRTLLDDATATGTDEPSVGASTSMPQAKSAKPTKPTKPAHRRHPGR